MYVIVLFLKNQNGSRNNTGNMCDCVTRIHTILTGRYRSRIIRQLIYKIKTVQTVADTTDSFCYFSVLPSNILIAYPFGSVPLTLLLVERHAPIQHPVQKTHTSPSVIMQPGRVSRSRISRWPLTNVIPSLLVSAYARLILGIYEWRKRCRLKAKTWPKDSYA